MIDVSVTGCKLALSLLDREARRGGLGERYFHVGQMPRDIQEEIQSLITDRGSSEHLKHEDKSRGMRLCACCLN